MIILRNISPATRSRLTSIFACFHHVLLNSNNYGILILRLDPKISLKNAYCKNRTVSLGRPDVNNLKKYLFCLFICSLHVLLYFYICDDLTLIVDFPPRNYHISRVYFQILRNLKLYCNSKIRLYAKMLYISF